MDNEAKFTEGKTSEISQAWSHTFLNLRNNSEHIDIVISATGRPQENWIFRFLNIHKKNRFTPDRDLSTRTKIKGELIVLVQSLTIANWVIPIVSQLFAPEHPPSSKTSEPRQEKNEKDQKMVSRLPRFIYLFKSANYYLLWINAILLAQRMFTYHGNLIGKSRITGL